MPKRVITHLVIHCSASPKATTSAAQIKRWHVEGNGWSDVGYHRIIEGDGAVMQGRPDDVAGAHAEGFNSKSLGVCVVGDFDREAIDLSDPQGTALIQVCAVLCQRYKIPPANIIGHRDTYPLLGKPVAKTCPGAHLHALLPRLRERVEGYLR